MLAFTSGVVGTLTPYVTSSFQLHSLTATTGIISQLISGLFKLPYCKIIDIWGRPQGLLVMLACFTLGLIMMAGCNNVQTYCAAQVFFWVGYLGISFSLTIFVADTTALRSRALMIGFIASPWLVTTWCSGPAAARILATVGFRWGFGVFAIAMPVACVPLLALMWTWQAEVRRRGLVPAKQSHGTLAQTLVHYAKEFDLVGLLILTTGLSLFLLSFSIYSYQPGGFGSPLIICFIVFGILLVAAFVLYEKFVAPTKFIPFELLQDRTVFFTFVMAACLYTGWYIWDSYFYSLNIVLFNQSITNASYIANIYTLGSCFTALVVGAMLLWYGKIKYYALFFGAPMTMLGVACMIAFRQPNVNIGYIVMCQLFIAFGGGTLVIAEQITVMAVSSQQNVPAVLAIEGMVISIASSVGSAIAAAMWTGIFPDKLRQNLPARAQGQFAAIYGSLVVQSSYAVGTPERDAINLSYAQTQRVMLITATCFYAVMIVATAFWRNIDVKNMKQRKLGLF